MKKTIELKLKLVEMLAKGAFGLNKDCMPLVREAFEFVTEDVDDINDLDLSDNVNGISDETSKELSERFAEIANTLIVGKEQLVNIKYAQPYLETALKDGVYLIYEQNENGQLKRWCELFAGNNNKDCAVAVAFKFGQVSLILYGQNIKDCKMTCDDKEPISVITSYAEAACDFMGRKRTQDLVARGLSCVDKLPESKDWYIPAIGELYVMYLMKNQINKALEYIGAELIKDTWYWSSTEYSATPAWYLGFDDGAFNTSYKTLEGSVRPVSAFNHLTL